MRAMRTRVSYVEWDTICERIGYRVQDRTCECKSVLDAVKNRPNMGHFGLRAARLVGNARGANAIIE